MEKKNIFMKNWIFECRVMLAISRDAGENIY
jgi:hypothetical protein